MAFMIPSTLSNQPDTTAGERKLFDLFRTTLPERCVVRYEMLLGQRHYRPDYTLVDPNRGVLVVEVKDWGVSSIAKATSDQFFVRYSRGAPTPQMNPDQKCEIYLRHARESLVAMPVLRGDASELGVALQYFVAFPNIGRQEFTDQHFDKVIPPEHVLLREDLAGAAFLQRYTEALPEPETPLTKEQTEAIKKALFPDTGFALGTLDGFIRQGVGIVSAKLPVEPIHLSLEQEQIAKSLGEGPRLLRGIAGTGKTLVMLYRAKLLAANHENMRILVLCWNTSLANYMSQAFEKIQFEAQGQVTIQHFSEFVRDLFRQRRQQHYDLDLDDPLFNERLQSLRITESDKYDAIYVDEAQDFRKEWIAFLYHRLLRGEPKERNLLVAADDAQRVYAGRDFSWASLDIPMVGRSKILKTVYRNSARVWVFSAFLLQEKAAYLREDPGRVHFSTKGGYDPQLIECDSLEAQIDKAVEITKVIIEDNFAARNVLILYRHKRIGGFSLVDRLTSRLNQEGIPNDWIAEDAFAKRTFDWDADTVKISTVHSAKGMDSPVVIVIGAEAFRPDLSDGEYDETKLMYVALTRAREFLVTLYTGNEGLVPQLLNCQEEYTKYRGVIIGLEE
jgi:hypothetical protein